MAKPDRIDFTILPDGRTIVTNFRFCQDDNGAPRFVPTATRIKEQTFNLVAALQWCEEHGYTVIQWPAQQGIYAGARAWKGPHATIIRTRHQIQRMRANHPYAQMDFALVG